MCVDKRIIGTSNRNKWYLRFLFQFLRKWKAHSRHAPTSGITQGLCDSSGSWVHTIRVPRDEDVREWADRCQHWPCLGAQGVGAELGAVSKGEKEERKAFQVACSVLGKEAGCVGSHVVYQTAMIVRVGDDI